MMKTMLVFLLVMAVSFAQTGLLTDERITELNRSGLQADELIRLIQTAPSISFDLTPARTEAMLKAGVSEDVIKAMAAREAVSTFASNALHPVSKQTEAPVAVQNVVSTSSGQSERHKMTYDGGSIINLKTGNNVTIYLDQNAVHILRERMEVLSLPSSAVTEISYGQDVHRRVGAAIGLATVSLGVGALMALTKSKKHFIGITWDVNGAKGGAAFQADKRDYRGVLEGLEGITGKRAVNSDSLTVKN